VAGEWTVLVGGNWTPTNHSNAHLVGDAEIYLCPCPEPPCDADPEPPKPGYSTSVFPCVSQDTLNASHTVCTVFHSPRTNVTCVTPSHAISCDVPAFDDNNSLVHWWENAEVPSRSFYSPNVTAVSCVVRSLGERPLQPDLRNFTDAIALQDSLSVERCEVVCRRVCRTVCAMEHLSVHALVPELNEWVFDATVDNNPREFIANGSHFQERRPAQYLRGASARTAGQERNPLNLTCTMPTMTAAVHEAVMGAPPANLSGMQGLFDMLGRRFQATNVFDLTTYVALHSLMPLENARCVTPFPNASRVEAMPGENEPYMHALVCHEPIFDSYNVSLGPASVELAGRRIEEEPGEGLGITQSATTSAARHRLTGEAGQEVPAGTMAVGEGRNYSGRHPRRLSIGGSDDEAHRSGADSQDEMLPGWAMYDDWYEWTEGNGSNWQWRDAATLSLARDEVHWSRRWRALRRSPPRRRQLHHEFEIARSPWDYWLDENAMEQQSRLTREHAERAVLS